MFQKFGGWQSVKDTKRVGALRKKGNTGSPERNPWGSGLLFLRRQKEKEREGHEERRSFFKRPADEHPEGAKAQEGNGLTSV
jgi:hypothetical protein